MRDPERHGQHRLSALRRMGDQLHPSTDAVTGEKVRRRHRPDHGEAGSTGERGQPAHTR